MHRDHCRAGAVSCGVSGWRQGRVMTGFSVCCWTGDSRGQRFTSPSAPSLSPDWLFGGSKKGFDEEDSEAPRHLAAAAAALPSTSWGPAELLCGSQGRETRCTLWSKHRLRGAVQVTPLIGVFATETLTVKRRRVEEGWCDAIVSLHRTKGF